MYLRHVVWHVLIALKRILQLKFNMQFDIVHLGACNDGIVGFPMSKFLRDQKVGLGRVARSLASHSLYRSSENSQVTAIDYNLFCLNLLF